MRTGVPGSAPLILDKVSESGLFGITGSFSTLIVGFFLATWVGVTVPFVLDLILVSIEQSKPMKNYRQEQVPSALQIPC